MEEIPDRPAGLEKMRAKRRIDDDDQPTEEEEVEDLTKEDKPTAPYSIFGSPKVVDLEELKGP